MCTRAYHAWPHDFWRYSRDDMARIFGDLEIVRLVSDPDDLGVFLKAIKPRRYSEHLFPEYMIYSVTRGRRISRARDYDPLISPDREVFWRAGIPWLVSKIPFLKKIPRSWKDRLRAMGRRIR